jgi:hypothetical protein
MTTQRFQSKVDRWLLLVLFPVAVLPLLPIHELLHPEALHGAAATMWIVLVSPSDRAGFVRAVLSGASGVVVSGVEH